MDRIPEQRALTLIAKHYTALGFEPQLINWLIALYPRESFAGLSKHDLHVLLNSTLLKSHGGEASLKYALYKQFLSKKKVVAAFEIRVNNSRADFLTINGSTSSFEIKSNRDNLLKLSKQASDYALTFEYNNIVIDERHLKNATALIPQNFGIWSFKGLKKVVHREASFNERIDPAAQLNLLTKKELKESFTDTDTKSIMAITDAQEINQQFKNALKRRYAERWKFVVKHSETILPIDVQFFFNTNILPHHIYQTAQLS